MATVVGLRGGKSRFQFELSGIVSPLTTLGHCSGIVDRQPALDGGDRVQQGYWSPMACRDHFAASP